MNREVYGRKYAAVGIKCHASSGLDQGWNSIKKIPLKQSLALMMTGALSDIFQSVLQWEGLIYAIWRHCRFQFRLAPTLRRVPFGSRSTWASFQALTLHWWIMEWTLLINMLMIKCRTPLPHVWNPITPINQCLAGIGVRDHRTEVKIVTTASKASSKGWLHAGCWGR